MGSAERWAACCRRWCKAGTAFHVSSWFLYFHVEQGSGEIDSTRAQGIYNAIFPYYAEVCVVTQYHKKGSTPGGWGGHASLFLHGAEIDPSRGYPRLQLAADDGSLSGPDTGTGISVNQILSNVNWVAIPGRDQFFRGGLTPEQTLDDASYEAAVETATMSGWFAGVKIKDSVMRRRPAAMPTTEFIVRNSIGTDFALNFARTAYCARLPLSREATAQVIAYLNGANERAQEGGYTWNAYTDNCSHITHNALAAAGVWDAKQTRRPGVANVVKDILSVAKAVALRRMSDFSFPANNFVRAFEAGNERPIDGAAAAFKDHDLIRTLNDGWMSTGPGALIVTYPMHEATRNRVFAAGRDPFLFSVPRVWDKEDKFKILTRNASPSLTDLGPNLSHFRDRFAEILARRRDVSEELTAIDVENNEQAFRLFYERFYQFIERQLLRTNSLITDHARFVDAVS